jgi:type II secretory ATPase GspE/PulE/Tfp pilus assembly ATPase PilB-like protein
MVLSDEIRAKIVAGASVDEIRSLALAQGLVPLRAAAWPKAVAGQTTVEEVLRVTSDEPAV